MSTSSASLAPQRQACNTPSLHVAVFFLFTTITFTAHPQSADAQAVKQRAPSWEFDFPSGGYIPTGQHRDYSKDALLSAVQVSHILRPAVALNARFSWARSRDLVSSGNPRLNVFIYDLGAEARPVVWYADRKVTLTPFGGLGFGARSYDSRNNDVATMTNVNGFVSLGSTLGMGRFRLRMEVRDYASEFSPPSRRSEWRNDIVFTTGLSIGPRRTS